MRKVRFAPLLLIPAITGCITLAAKAPPVLLTLSPDRAPATDVTINGSAATALRVMEPATGAELAAIRVAVVIDPARIAYLPQAQWVDRPARLMQHLLAETLRARGNRLIGEGDSATQGPMLTGRLIECGYDVPAQAVVVRFDAIRHNPDGTIDSRRFQASIDHVAADTDAVGPALNQAANQVAKAVADWIG